MQEIASDAVYFKDKSKDNLREKSEKKTIKYKYNKYFFSKKHLFLFCIYGWWVFGSPKWTALWLSISKWFLIERNTDLCRLGFQVLDYFAFGKIIKCYMEEFIREICLIDFQSIYWRYTYIPWHVESLGESNILSFPRARISSYRCD